MPNDEKLSMIRHSMAHVMAEAVLEIFPEAKIAIGPSIENGFYYDGCGSGDDYRAHEEFHRFWCSICEKVSHKGGGKGAFRRSALQA